MRDLIVVGASVRAAAWSAIRAGLSPYAIDMFADRDLAAMCPAVKISRFPGKFLQALAAAPDAPWIYAGGLENHPRLVNRMAAIRPLLGNRGQILRLVRDPLRFRLAVEEAGCRYPDTSFSAVSADRVWLVKRRRSGGGIGVRFADADELKRPPRGCYLQQYVEGESASAVFVAAGGRAVLLGATRQLLGRDFGLDRPFLYVGSLGPLSLRDDEEAKLKCLGNLLAERFGVVGLFNVDFVQTDSALWPVELNPRYSASIEVLERVTDQCFLRMHVNACETETLPGELAAANNRFAGKAVVYAQRDAIVPPALDRIAAEWNAQDQAVGLADLPVIGEKVLGGQPVVTVFADGTSLDDVEAALRRRVTSVDAMFANRETGTEY